MKYKELELVAACAVGVTASTLTVLFEYITGYGVVEMAFSAVCMFVIASGSFVTVSDRIDEDRERKARRRHKAKQVDFRVGRPIPGSNYVEVSK